MNPIKRIPEIPDEPKKLTLAGRSKSVEAVVRPRFTKGRCKMPDDLGRETEEEKKAYEQKRDRKDYWHYWIGRECWERVRNYAGKSASPFQGGCRLIERSS